MDGVAALNHRKRKPAIPKHEAHFIAWPRAGIQRKKSFLPALFERGHPTNPARCDIAEREVDTGLQIEAAAGQTAGIREHIPLQTGDSQLNHLFLKFNGIESAAAQEVIHVLRN